MVKHSPDPREAPPPATRSGTFSAVAILRVRLTPDPILATRAVDVDPGDPAIVALAAQLTATMRASPACVGLAAPQVGHAVRLFCMDVSAHPRARSSAGLVVLANPKVLARSADVVRREGCLSVPHLTGNVPRSAAVTVEGLEPGTARLVRLSADAIEARCIQHEIDHLDGLVFLDRVRSRFNDVFARRTFARGRVSEIVHTVSVRAQPSQVYRALTNQGALRGWWTRTGEREPRVDALTEFRLGALTTAAIMRIVELVDGLRVVWRCVDGPPEWVGTDITFDLAPRGESTQVRFRHRSARPAALTGESSAAWARFLFSLKSILETPDPDDLET